jgi:ferredoxin-NADP reductase
MAPSTGKFRVIENRAETPTVKTLVLSPEKRFKFRPGQFVNIYVQNGETRLCRAYTIASPPGKGEIEITYKLRGIVTNLLWKVKPGEKLSFLGPLGKFFFRPGAKRAIFIGGGIGVSGVIAGVRTVAKSRGKTNATLFYSIREADDIPFLPELMGLESAGKLKLVLTITGENVPENWPGKTGRIDYKMLQDNLEKGDIRSGDFYVCGSTSFAADIHKALLKLGVKDARIKKEGFG